MNLYTRCFTSVQQAFCFVADCGNGSAYPMGSLSMCLCVCPSETLVCRGWTPKQIELVFGMKVATEDSYFCCTGSESAHRKGDLPRRCGVAPRKFSPGCYVLTVLNSGLLLAKVGHPGSCQALVTIDIINIHDVYASYSTLEAESSLYSQTLVNKRSTAVIFRLNYI